MKSRCPHCASSYDIPEAALAAADGVVRCGNCMQLFDAEKNQVAPEPEQNDPVQSTLSEVTPGEVDALLEVTFDENDLDSPEAEEGFNQEEETEPTYLSSGDSDSKNDRPEEKTAETLSLETHANEEEVVETVSLQQKLKAAEELIEETKDQFAESSGIEANEALNENAVSEEDKALFLQEPEMETLVGDASQPAEDPVSETNFESLELAVKNQGEQNKAFSETEQQLKETEITETENGAFEFDANTAVELDNHFVNETSTRAAEKVSPNLLSRIGFSIAACLVAAVLLLQWMLAYSLLPQTKSEFMLKAKDTACRYLFCDVNLQKNIANNYQSIDLLVQSHPTEKDALVLKTTLLNRSGRTLPYPRLAVEFSDLSNQVTAARVFTPEDYLNDQLLSSSSNGLSANQPIEIELEFVDPGTKAVNYSLHFLPSQG